MTRHFPDFPGVGLARSDLRIKMRPVRLLVLAGLGLLLAWSFWGLLREDSGALASAEPAPQGVPSSATPEPLPPKDDPGPPPSREGVPSSAESQAPPSGALLRVIDTFEHPIAHARVTAIAQQTERSLSCDERGHLRLDIDRVDQLTIGAPGFATCQYAGGPLRAGKEHLFRLPLSARLRVRVIDRSGVLIEGQRVDAVVEEKLNDSNAAILDRIVAYTDKDGVATFEGLGAAQYWVSVPQWRRWSGVDLYGIRPLAGDVTIADALVTARPDEECLDILVGGLSPAAMWGQHEHPRFSVEIEGTSGLERIYPGGVSTIFGKRGMSVKVRVVATEGGYPRPEKGQSAWQVGVLGQSRPLAFEMAESTASRK